MGRADPGAHTPLNIRKESKGEDESRDRNATKGIKGENEEFEAPLDISEAIFRIKIPVEYGALQGKRNIGDCTAKRCHSCSYTNPGIKTSHSMWR